MSKFSKMSIFYVIFLFIFIIAFSGYLRNGVASDITFSGLLNYLSNSPSINVSWSFIDLTIYNDWGLFNFLRNFFNWFTDIIEVFVMLFGMIVKGLSFIVYFVKGLFYV